jgi:hypothetical protein
MHLKETFQENCNTICQSVREEVPNIVCERILSTFEVNGAVPLTQEKVQGMIETLRDQIEKALQHQLSTLSAVSNGSRAAEEVSEDNQNSAVRESRQWSWGGRLHPVPENYTFPNGTLKHMWDLWFKGIPAQSIGPLRLVSKYDLTSKVDQMRLAKCSSAMQFLLSIAKTKGLVRDRGPLAYPSGIRCEETFVAVFTELIRLIPEKESRRTRRVGDILLTTVYEDIRKLRKASQKEN